MKKLISITLILLLVLASLPAFAESTAEPALTVGTVVEFGTYEQDNDTKNGKEPIEWTVLAVEDSKALLLANYGLAAISYCEPMDGDSYSASGLYWETSYLRSWLNDQFLTDAFSEEAQEKILLSTLETSDAYGKFTTEDKVFCLSIAETKALFGNALSMACGATEYAKSGLQLDSGALDKNGYCVWWLRDMASCAKPAKDFNFMSATYNEGAVLNQTYGLDTTRSMPVFCDYLATVRPALWLDMTDLGDLITIHEEEKIVYTQFEKGAKGDNVKALQERLNALGYDVGTADGSFGNKTKAGIELFQKQNKLAVNGIATVKTQEVLFSDDAVEAPVVRKLNESFTVNGQKVKITSVKFMDRYKWKYGGYNNPSPDIYLCVKLTLTNNTGKSLASSYSYDSDAHPIVFGFDTLWKSKEYYGTRFPASEDGYSALFWGLSENYIGKGRTIDMVYLITVPKEAKNSGSLVLEFEDGSSYIVR